MGLENPLHLAILFLVILLLFGARRLPELGRSLGEGMRGFKDSLTGDSSDRSQSLAQPPAPQPQTTSPAPEPVAAPTPPPAEPTPAAVPSGGPAPAHPAPTPEPPAGGDAS